MSQEKVTIQLLGQEVVLDRPFAPPDAESVGDLSSNGYDKFVPLHRQAHCLETYYHSTPYACNFNLDVNDPNLYDISKSVDYLNGKVIMTESKSMIDDLRQYNYMVKLIHDWMSSFRRCMAPVAKFHRDIDAYVIFFEKTQNGVIHAHGLIYVNNTYHSATSEIMANAWCSVSGANHRAQRKKNKMGKYDKAFDKCNNVEKWIHYITKEYNYYVRYFSDLEKGYQFNRRVKAQEAIEALISTTYI